MYTVCFHFFFVVVGGGKIKGLVLSVIIFNPSLKCINCIKPEHFITKQITNYMIKSDLDS